MAMSLIHRNSINRAEKPTYTSGRGLYRAVDILWKLWGSVKWSHLHGQMFPPILVLYSRGSQVVNMFRASLLWKCAWWTKGASVPGPPEVAFERPKGSFAECPTGQGTFCQDCLWSPVAPRPQLPPPPQPQRRRRNPSVFARTIARPV